jgi:peptidyl-prolyl cis-trans isomerase SurA
MPKFLHVLSITLFFGMSVIHAEDKVLFTVADTKVNTSEFEYIYQKNNFNNKADYSRKSLEDYLNLYVNFRLKVKEAVAEGLDTNERFKEELSTYEKQLVESYVEKDMMDKLIRQEYERSKTDVNISHIFIQPVENNWDAAYEKVLDIYNQIKKGLSFDEAVKFSQDKQSAEKGGKIGWFNSYQISLPEVEEAVYGMKVGEVSTPVKTRVGYHILKLNVTRPARPRLKVAIIKRFFPIQDTSVLEKKAQEDTIRYIYSKLKNGESFEKMVAQYTEDESTKYTNGALDWFGINVYAKVFEETAYALKDGEIAAPFKTGTAWYIIKRLETAKPQTLEASAPIIKSKLLTLPQYQYEMEKFVGKLREKYNVREFGESYPGFKTRLSRFAQVSPFAYIDTLNPGILMKIGDRTYTENDFGKKIQEIYYMVIPKQGMDKNDALIHKTVQTLILDYYKNDIKENNKEYKALMEEYKNGIMIFSLSEKNVWNKASEDSLGLITYFKEHKSDFTLRKRATVRTVTIDNAQQAKSVSKILQSDRGLTDDMLATKMKALGIENPKINSEVAESGKSIINISTESLSKPLQKGNEFVITHVYNLQPEKPRTFEECRGYVVAAYQEYLEKKWLENLRKKYPVLINKEVFESLIRK